MLMTAVVAMTAATLLSPEIEEASNEPRAERISCSFIELHNIPYARVDKGRRAFNGVSIDYDLSIGIPRDTDETIIFEVPPNEVITIECFFRDREPMTITVPLNRISRLQRYIQLRAELVALEAEFGGGVLITDVFLALQQLSREQELMNRRTQWGTIIDPEPVVQPEP